jgi:hypothetical protein
MLNPTDILSRNAASNLARYIGNGGKPIVRPVTRKQTPPGSTPPKKLATPAPRVTSNSGPKTTFGIPLPPPLPEVPESSPKKILVSVMIGCAGILGIGAGIYFYVQAESVWQNTGTHAADSPSPKNSDSTLSEVISAPPLYVPSATLAEALKEPQILEDRIHSKAMAPARKHNASQSLSLEK